MHTAACKNWTSWEGIPFVLCGVSELQTPHFRLNTSYTGLHTNIGNQGHWFPGLGTQVTSSEQVKRRPNSDVLPGAWFLPHSSCNLNLPGTRLEPGFRNLVPGGLFLDLLNPRRRVGWKVPLQLLLLGKTLPIPPEPLKPSPSMYVRNLHKSPEPYHTQTPRFRTWNPDRMWTRSEPPRQATLEPLVCKDR